jgi:isocitrate lyase
VHEQYPGKKLAYNCSPSFNWRSKLSDDEIEAFQDEIGKLGYVFQFVTLAGFHTLNLAMFELADGYRDTGMKAFSALQQKEFAAEDRGFTPTKHQRQVGAGYFDDIAEVISGGAVSTGALERSTEAAQF